MATKTKGKTKTIGMSTADFRSFMGGICRQTIYRMEKMGRIKVHRPFPGAKRIYITEYNGMKWNGEAFASEN